MHSLQSKRWRRRALSCAALLSCAAVSGSALAAYYEPFDNNPPWQGNTRFSYVLATDGRYSSPAGSLEVNGDVDYVTLSCAPSSDAEPARFVTSVGLAFVHSAGDLDIEAYTIDGVFVGRSQGTTNSELINTYAYHAKELQTVVLKIYGYQGAKGDYLFNFTCRQ